MFCGNCKSISNIFLFNVDDKVEQIPFKKGLATIKDLGPDK